MSMASASTAADVFPQAVLLRAAVVGEISFVGIDDPAIRLKPGFIGRLHTPALAVLVANIGPGKVKAAKSLRDWAKISIVHAIREDPRDYAMIADIVHKNHRVLLVETVPSLAMMWIAYLRERNPATFGWVAGKGVI